MVGDNSRSVVGYTSLIEIQHTRLRKLDTDLTLWFTLGTSYLNVGR